MSIYTGAVCRMQRLQRGMPLKTLAVLTGISSSKLCIVEHGQSLLREDTRRRIEVAFARVDGLRAAICPAPLDLSDAAALVAALQAFEAGRFARPENPPEIVKDGAGSGFALTALKS